MEDVFELTADVAPLTEAEKALIIPFVVDLIHMLPFPIQKSCKLTFSSFNGSLVYGIEVACSKIPSSEPPCPVVSCSVLS